jgi:hypothetical protein
VPVAAGFTRQSNGECHVAYLVRSSQARQHCREKKNRLSAPKRGSVRKCKKNLVQLREIQPKVWGETWEKVFFGLKEKNKQKKKSKKNLLHFFFLIHMSLPFIGCVPIAPIARYLYTMICIIM